MKISTLVLKISVLISLCFTGYTQQNQNAFNAFNEERNAMSKKSMLTLGAWSAANIVFGTVGMLTTSDESRYFHQMNAGWNTVNLLIAGLGWRQVKQEDYNAYTFAGSLQKQQQIEQTFLFNTALNFTYITSGLLLIQRGKIDTERFHQWNGYGKSLILQGGFLLAFDAVNFWLHKRHFQRELLPLLTNIQISNQGFSLIIPIEHKRN